MSPTLTQDIENSPLPSTVDKFWEAWYFLLAMTGEYHDPHAFRYNLNAFIQAFRNITFILQSEESRPPGFEVWYSAKRAEMREIELLKRLVDARNLIVKKSMLAPSSEVRLGLFKGRRFKLGVGGPIDPFRDSRELLQKACEFYVGFYIDERHSDFGEQVGVWRKWVVEEIGSDEVVTHCAEALGYMSRLLEEAHEVWGASFDASFKVPHPDAFQSLLESDIDPSLPIKWGWVKEKRLGPSKAGTKSRRTRGLKRSPGGVA
jgi:hypothetical protein